MLIAEYPPPVLLGGVELGTGFIHRIMSTPSLIRDSNMTPTPTRGMLYKPVHESRSKLHTTQKDTPPGARYPAINVCM